MAQGELLNPGVRGRLGRLGAVIYGRLFGEGLAWLVILLVGLVFVTLGLDYTLRLDRPLRGVITAAALAAVLLVCWRQLIAPLRVPVDDEGLALLVENRYGQLADRLISAVQFSRPGRRADVMGSEAMIARMAQETNELLALLRFRGIVEGRRMLQTAGAALLAAAVLAGFALWKDDTMYRWFVRNVAFWRSDVAWPQDTYLEVLDGPDFPVLRGDDLRVVIEVEERSEKVPPYLILHTLYPSVGSKTQQKLDPDPNNPRRFIKVFEAVSEPFQFYVTGGDDKRDKRREHQVLLIEPPALVGRVRWHCEYPAYMSPRSADPGSGRGILSVFAGTTVTVRATASKELRSAKMVITGKETEEIPMSPDRGGEGPRGLIGVFKITGKSRAETKRLRFLLEDTEGFTNRKTGQQYTVQIQPDMAPNVDLRKKAVGSTVTPRAVIPLVVQAKDDHGVAAVNLTGSANKQKLRPISEAMKPEAEARKDFLVTAELDLVPLKLKPGDTLGVRAEATDALPEKLGGPNVGTSGRMSFRIIRPEELMAELVRRQKELRLDFIEAIGLQETARAKALAGHQALAGDTVSLEARRLLGEAAISQSTVGAECASAADKLQAILDEMVANRLGAAADYAQMTDGVIKPIRGLSEPIGQLTAALNGTSAVKEVAELREQIVQIAEIQDGIRRRMEAILEEMRKIESRHELASQLQLIIKWWQQVVDDTRKYRDKQIKTILGPTTQPGGEKPKKDR